MEQYVLLGLESEEELIPWVRKRVAGVIKRVPSCVYELDDMTSIALLALTGALKQYDESRKKTFKAYCVIRIRGAVLDALRLQARRRPIDSTLTTYMDDLAPDIRFYEEDTPELSLLKKEMHRQLAEEVSKLPAVQKSVLFEFAVLDRSMQEIADSHGRATKGFASKVLKKAVGRLREPLLKAGVDSMKVAA